MQEIACALSRIPKTPTRALREWGYALRKEIALFEYRLYLGVTKLPT